MIEIITIMAFAIPAVVAVTAIVALAVVFVEKTDRMVNDDYNRQN